MNITRAQGRAALKRMEELAKLGLHVWIIGGEAREGVRQLGWGESLFNTHRGNLDLNEVLLALAMVVAISGVEHD